MDVLDDAGMDAALPAEIDHDRCESCIQEAHLWVEVNGTAIAYCKHHGTKYFDGLVLSGRILRDTRHELP